ncbi:hypothetical protein SeLEV6574_g00701 [Synchytrium endobioticum]|uniref:Peptidase S26 domain-containing protein n=1 Tax=Synchytrium endobioticum TaxID=286115 RepID=A0A507DGL5_9FUNG|nr:hypothetical protein SeLEV6574_g00701 [Synchytrium endobioticum]
MSPTLNPDYSAPSHDWVILNKAIPRQDSGIQRGDVVLLTSPTDPDLTLCKRIVAMENDLVNPKENGMASMTWIKVPTGHAWVEGDGKLNSEVDSNKFGPVPLGLVTARVDWIIWPLNRVMKMLRNRQNSEEFVHMPISIHNPTWPQELRTLE